MTSAKPIAQVRGVAARVSETLAQDERIRVIWLTGSVARGTADSSSDVDLRIAVTDESYQKIGFAVIGLANVYYTESGMISRGHAAFSSCSSRDGMAWLSARRPCIDQALA